MRGLMFTAENTIANLKGRKTCTSRTYGLKKINENPDNWTFEYKELGTFYFVPKDKHCIATMVKCPFGIEGSEIYGKETYTYVTLAEKDPWKDRAIADGSFRWMPNNNPVTMVYKADGIEIPASWSSPMMMPEWASRYHIILNKIICQRIQDISKDDCIREGIQPHFTDHPYYGAIQTNPIDDFKNLWDSINLKSGHGWNKNEWVFRLYYDVKKK